MRQPVPRIDDYKVYWREVVTPDYYDFLRQDDNLRGAFHCAISPSTWRIGSITATLQSLIKNSRIVTELDNYPSATKKHSQTQ